MSGKIEEKIYPTASLALLGAVVAGPVGAMIGAAVGWVKADPIKKKIKELMES